MMDDVRLPPELRSAARRFSDLAAEAETKAIRLRQFTPPAVPPIDPARLAAEADRPGASAQLRAVAAAVRSGRTSWAEVVQGGADDVSEVRELKAHLARTALDELRQSIMDNRRSPRSPIHHDDEDFSDEQYLY